MFATKEEGSCLIGTPKFKLDLSRRKWKEQLQSPFITKIGGNPIWHDNFTAPQSIQEITCGCCGKSQQMVLVAQIFAPTTTDRSIYIFCCNSRKCSLHSSGWVVIRNQAYKNEENNIEPVETNSGKSLNELTKSTPKTSVWDFLDDSTDASTYRTRLDSIEENSTHDSFGIDPGLDDLNALLEKRDYDLIQVCSVRSDFSVNSQNSLVSIESHPTFSTAKHMKAELKLNASLPCWLLEDNEEPWFDDLGADDEDEDDLNYSTHNSDAHIDSLIGSYLEAEEDEDVVNLIKGTKTNNPQKTVSSPTEQTRLVLAQKTSETSNEVFTQDKPTKSKKTGIRKQSKHSTSDNSMTTTDALGEDRLEKTLSRSDMKSKVEARFQSRVSVEPAQVLRYAYGGLPLWISYPFPNISTESIEENMLATDSCAKTEAENQINIPCCEICGSKRVFECQLMPALLTYVGKQKEQEMEVESGTNSGDTSVGSSKVKFVDQVQDRKDLRSEIEKSLSTKELLEEKLGNEMDFGVVAIYSCPNSCNVNMAFATKEATDLSENPVRNFAKEVAVVQVPPDISFF